MEPNHLITKIKPVDKNLTHSLQVYCDLQKGPELEANLNMVIQRFRLKYENKHIYTETLDLQYNKQFRETIMRVFDSEYTNLLIDLINTNITYG